jgi:hypothetical protein
MIKLAITRNFKTKLPVYWPHIHQSQHRIPHWFVDMNYKYCQDRVGSRVIVMFNTSERNLANSLERGSTSK